MIPGRTLHRLAAALCSPMFCDRVVEPLLADFQHELEITRGFRRLRILAGGYGAFWWAFGTHALSVWAHELCRMSWRDVLPFPGVLAIVMVSLSVSHAWVTTGSVMNARFDQVDTKNLWLMLPVFVLQRWIRLESSVGAFAVHAAAFAGFALLVNAMVVLRPFMRGGMAFAVFCVVMILVQKKNSIVEAPHRD